MALTKDVGRRQLSYCKDCGYINILLAVELIAKPVPTAHRQPIPAGPVQNKKVQ